MVILTTLGNNYIPIKRIKYLLPSLLKQSKRMWKLNTMSQYRSQEIIQLIAEIIILVLAQACLKS